MRISKKVMLVFATCMMFLLIVFQNMQIVSIRLLFWRLDISLLILLPAILIVGLCVGFILGKQK